MSSTTKNFKHYLELPSEMRMMINDEMNAADMCRFTRCSRLCQREARKSKKYIYGLKFDNSSEQFLGILVDHEDRHYSYQLSFQIEDGKKCMKYSTPFGNSWKDLWMIDLDISSDLVQLATNYFKSLLELYQNTIKVLRITGNKNLDFGIWSLKNLRFLELSTYVDNIMEVISRRKKHLDYFEYHGDMEDKLLEADGCIFQVQNLSIPSLKLNIDQLRQLSASDAVIHIGDLTPNDIFHFITSWKNGELRENFESCSWELKNSSFKVKQLWRLLKIELDDSRSNGFEINHNKEIGKFAALYYFNYPDKVIAFKVEQS